MNVTLSKRGGYVARAAISLARAYPTGRPKKLREISAEMDIPRTFVSQILGDLVHAGLAVSSFGRDGGHRLARPPADVTVAEVVEAAEGTLVADRCALGDGPCRWHAVCPLHETMTTATASLREVLSATTLATLVERDLRIAEGTYPIPADAHPHVPATPAADSVHVELPAASVAARLTAGAGWLTRHAQAWDEDEARIRVGPVAPGWLGKTVAVHLGEPVTAADGALAIPLVWQATGPAGLFPRFDGDLRLVELDEQRSELRLDGHYRPPLGKAGHALDDALLARVARASLRALLRRVARGLEEEGDAGTGPPPEAGEEPAGAATDGAAAQQTATVVTGPPAQDDTGG